MAQKTQVITQQPGLFKKFFEELHLDTLIQKIKMNKQMLIDMGLFGTIGFITGFLCKRYSEYVIVLALFILCLIMLQHLNIITVSINVNTLQKMFDIPYIPMITSETYLFFLWEWIKGHVPATMSFFVGILIGLKTG